MSLCLIILFSRTFSFFYTTESTSANACVPTLAVPCNILNIWISTSGWYLIYSFSDPFGYHWMLLQIHKEVSFEERVKLWEEERES